MGLLWMVSCPDCHECGLKKLVKYWRCLTCGHKFTEEIIKETLITLTPTRD